MSRGGRKCSRDGAGMEQEGSRKGAERDRTETENVEEREQEGAEKGTEKSAGGSRSEAGVEQEGNRKRE